MFTFTILKKPLIQIAFDFSPPVEEAANTTILPVLEEPVQELTVAITEPETEEVQEEMVTPEKETTVDLQTPSAGKRGRKSLKDITLAADLIHIPEDEELFKKQYYSIGEVAVMFRENQSLIRYWETEFDILQPRKNRKGDRFFRPVDIKNLVMIYDLLRRRKFTIEGAKDYLKKNKKAEERFAAIQSLQKVKGFLLEMRANL